MKKKILLSILFSLIFICLFAGFTDVTETALPEVVEGHYSVAWVDINNNGLQDAFVGAHYFYLNNGDGTFTLKDYDEFLEWNLTRVGNSWGRGDTRVAFADANNNGYIDMVIVESPRFPAEYPSSRVLFFENSGPPDYTFTGQLVYTFRDYVSGGQPVFVDINGDGKMEIYTGTFGNWAAAPGGYIVGMDQLFRQNDEGGWDNITEEHIPQLTNPQYHRPGRGVNACDYDMDFDMDIFVPIYTVGSFNAANYLWVNDGNGFFEDGAAEAGVDLEPHGRYALGLASGAAFGDFTNNGWFDLCVANIHGWAAVYENNKDGTFTNTTQGRGLYTHIGGGAQEKQWHNADWIDHNNNGYLDLWLTQWYGHEGFVCYVFENQGPENPGYFIDVTEELGFTKMEEFNNVRGLAAGDYNGNGFPDILFYTDLRYNRDHGGVYLFRNNGNDNNWMQIKLVGDGENVSKSAMGCQARIFYKDGTASYIKQVESTSSDQTMHQHTLHFGLGKQEEIHQVMVRWLDGRVEYWQGEEIGEVNRIITLSYGTGSTTSTFLSVDVEYEGVPDGSAYSPYPSLQQAIDNSENGYIISVEPGYYLENIDFDGKDIKIVASGSIEETVIMGAVIGEPNVLFSGGETERAILKGFHIRGEAGTGIRCIDSSPTIIGCEISLNEGIQGGGFNLTNSKIHIIECVISRNSSTSGGAIYAENSDIQIERTVFQANSANEGSVIKGTGSTVNLINCLITGNLSNGGAINLQRGRLHIEFCTIANNSSGLILSENPDEGGWSVLNSIIYDNGSNDFTFDHPPVVRYSNITNPFEGEGNISVSPRFAYPENDDWSLSPFSLCIGAGIATDIIDDLNGAPRPYPEGTDPDMGCFESERSAPAPAVLYVAETGNDNDGDGTEINPFATISYTLANSIGGETIIVSPGTYYDNIVFGGKNSRIVSYYEATKDKSYIEKTVIDGGEDGAVVTFSNNETYRAQLSGFTITNGRRTNGGGISIVNSSPSLSNLVIKGNTATTNGGGILIQEAQPIIRDVVVSENNAGNFGAGIFIINSRPSLRNIDIHKNRANINGGIAVNNSTITGKHLTIADNEAYGNNPQTGGIFSVNSAVYLVNSILWGNQPSQTASLLNGTIDIFYSSIEGGFEGEGNIDSNPLFLNPVKNDYRLEANSPCRDAGTNYLRYNNLELINLQPGEYSGSAPDMGAYDYLFSDIEDRPLPEKGLSLSIAPNPFNPDTELSFILKEESMVKLQIFNIKGQLVTELINERLPVGEHKVVWTGKDRNNNRSASGVYLALLSSNDKRVLRKMVLLK